MMFHLLRFFCFCRKNNVNKNQQIYLLVLRIDEQYVFVYNKNKGRYICLPNIIRKKGLYYVKNLENFVMYGNGFFVGVGDVNRVLRGS
jgi:hypothetical protein